jgi:hypothetical protein
MGAKWKLNTVMTRIQERKEFQYWKDDIESHRGENDGCGLESWKSIVPMILD